MKVQVMVSYQRAISHKPGEVFVFALVDFLFQDAQGHGLFDDFVVIGHVSLVHAALEESRRIIATAAWSVCSRSQRKERSGIQTHSSSR
jgi:hypothetical protein